MHFVTSMQKKKFFLTYNLSGFSVQIAIIINTQVIKIGIIRTMKYSCNEIFITVKGIGRAIIRDI